MKMTKQLRLCLIGIIVCFSLLILSFVFENAADGVVRLRCNPTPKIQLEACKAQSHYGNADQTGEERCQAGNAGNNQKPEKGGDMSEIIAAFIGALVGSVLTCFLLVIQRHYEQWKSFQERIFSVQERFEEPDFEERVPIEAIARIHTVSIDEVADAVSRIRPYLLSNEQRSTMNGLLKKYRRAGKTSDSGLIGMNPVPDRDPAKCFPASDVAKVYLIGILNGMASVMKWGGA